MKIKTCTYYDNGVCIGTRERDVCSCNGNPLRCSFYPEKITEAIVELNPKCEDCKKYSDECDEWCEAHCRFGMNPTLVSGTLTPCLWEEDCRKTSNTPLKENPNAQSTTHAPSMVDHPSHYNQGGIECIDAMVAAFGIEEVKIFCKLNAFKYLWRSEEKNGAEDISKAQWYINKFQEL